MQADTGQSEPGGFGYVLALIVPAILAACALLGSTAGDVADWVALLPLGIAFAIVPLLTISGGNWDEPGPVRPGTSGARLYYRALPLAAAPAQLMTLCLATNFWCGSSLHLAGRIGWLLSIGIFSALFAITVAHELIHHRDPFDRAVGGFLLSTACFGAFKIVHLRVHHRFVGTAFDFSSARRGASLYGFWLGCLYGNPREALRYERARQRRLGLPWWRSELLVWYGLSAGWLALWWLVWNWTGTLFLLLQSAVAILTLDWTNYVQHYGLRRRPDARGRYEPVQPHHAWSMQCRITNLALLNLLRHGDHHTHPTVPYYALTHTAAPAYPYPFGIMMLLALVPPLFHRIVHPLLDRVAAETAG